MTFDEPRADTLPHDTASATAVTAAAPTPSHAALERYNRRMRRGRVIYFGIIAAVVLAVGASVAVVWSHGETAHTTLRTAAHPAPSVALRPPSATLQPAWQSTDRTAIGTPYWGGTVVTYSADSVRGRNATTGAIAWSYTRTDRTVCQAIQDQGITVAIFEVHGNCDQATALDSGTGERRWTRTFDKDGKSLDGHPAYSMTQSTLMLTTPSVIYAIDPAGGLDRWVYHVDGCTIQHAVIGAQGALISQTCAKPKCDGLTFCGTGRQLLLRDASAGRSDADADKANPDRITWDLIGTTAVPASADAVISAVDADTGQLQVFEAKKGTTVARLALRGGVASAAGIVGLATDRAELVWIAGSTYAVALSGAAFLWSATTTAPPTVTSGSGTPLNPPGLKGSTLATGGPGGIALLDPDTGTSVATFPVAAPPAGSVVYPFGSGFVVTGAPTTVYR